MPEYVCRLGTPDGRVLEQRRVAATTDVLRHELESEGLHVFSISAARARLHLPFIGGSTKVSGQDFLLFNTQLATLLRAGLPLAQGLDLLRDQQANEHFRALLAKVHQQVTTGVSLSDAFLALGDVFPRLYANTLRAGERSGELEVVLGRYVEYQRLTESVRKKIIGALTYPAVLVALSVVLVVILMVRVIPAFSTFYVQFDAELPLPTRIIMGTATGLQDHFLIVTAAVIGLVVAFRAWRKSPSGRRITDRWRLKLPLVGRLAHLFAVSQFTRSLAVLLGGGTPMVPALDTSATSVSNSYLAELFRSCVQEVQEGRSLSDSLDDTGQMPELALAMMRVGEATGALPEMLEHTSGFLDEEIEFSLNRLVTLFEPLILVVMGIIVAALLLAVYYPLLTTVTKIG
ncbi:MAG TPA: type II secretion system F family protein [Candidatus Sulfomarinibacteraceae bacterium]|nr:type II secretion system F family protein [Candidatus Sulfomarinibacteraceae bacterium]